MYEAPPALEVKNPKPGVKYEYYEGIWERLPNFDSLSSRRSGVIEQIVLPKENSGENFGLQYNGYIKVPSDGMFTFYVTSDDGADLSIDKSLVVDNDGRHAPQEESGIIMLRAGFHEIKVRFFQGPGRKALEVSMEGPGLKRQVIPAEILFH
ncbi:MAG: PA14 domain-containing protein [Bacteroidota bacterium]